MILPLSKTMLPSEYVKMGWCQHQSARTEDGRSTAPGAYDASRVCLLGAISRAFYLRTITPTQMCGLIKAGDARWNDASGRTQAEVVAELARRERAIGLRR